ncbi:MAG: hypothetical protein WDN23_07380 [Edaphobacter sp.]
MKRIAILLALFVSAAPLLRSQARDIPSAQPTEPAGSTPEARGHKLLDEMLEALGGETWLDRENVRGVRAYCTVLSGRADRDCDRFYECAAVCEG